MTKRKSKSENHQDSKPDNSVKAQIISTIGVIAAALITALLAPAILRSLDNAPTTEPTVTPALAVAAQNLIQPTQAIITPTLDNVPLPTVEPANTISAVDSANPTNIFISELPIYDADASSFSPDRSPYELFDNNIAWTSTWFSSEGDQIGAWVRVAMPEVYTVSQLRIYMVIPPLRDIADQPKEVLLTFDDGSTYNAELTYDDGWQSINFPPVNTSTVQITIQDIYPSQWENKKRVSIREVKLFGMK